MLAQERASLASLDNVPKSDKVPKIAILGAGLMGRMLALSLKNVAQVELFDQDEGQGEQSAAYLAAAMLAPLSESADASKEIMALGALALTRWPCFLERLDCPVFFQQAGSVIVAFEQDLGNLEQFKSRLKGDEFDTLSDEQLQALEPELNPRLKHGIYLPNEGQLDNRELLEALAQTLKNSSVLWHHNAFITRIADDVTAQAPLEAPQFLHNGQPLEPFDWIIDCRGFGQKAEQSIQTQGASASSSLTLPALRGVRGEVVRLKAPDVKLNRPVRLMHPRYPIYITPKENGLFVVGATQLETEDTREPTVRSVLELLSACFSVHSGFAEAEILGIYSGIRPAYLDNEPKIVVQKNVLNVNGLFRHGFLLAPVMVDACLGVLNLGDRAVTQLHFKEVINKMPDLVCQEGGKNVRDSN